MRTPLIDIEIPSSYFAGGIRALLPTRMARCTPDTRTAILKLREGVRTKGGALFLSELYRSYDMQLQSHHDWKAKKKKAFSPPPGGSMHEAGRALDLDLKALKMPLSEFWAIAASQGSSRSSRHRMGSNPRPGTSIGARAITSSTSTTPRTRGRT
jgi:D-alanyl-D-alanine carboxypeptidase.